MTEAQVPNEVYHLVVYSFPGQKRAGEVVKLIKKGQGSGGYQVKAWAVVEVNEKGKSNVSQSGHGGIGAGIGAGVGVVLGLIGGPAGLLVWTLGAATVGGIAGKKMASFLPEDELKAVAAQMQPNTSAIIVVVQDTAAEAIGAEMGEHGAKVVTLTVGDQLSGEVAQFAAVDLGEPGEAEAAAGAPAAPASDTKAAA